MKKGNHWLGRIQEEMDLLEENIVREPLLELCGNSRVLIENHCGVIEYGPQRIRVKIKNGDFGVIGTDLQLCHMCGEKLLIRGRIEQILVRKGRN